MKRLIVLSLWCGVALLTPACNITDDEPPLDARCGDADETPDEACDDGNTDDGDYCSADCSARTGSCGDGTMQDNEACDDGNAVDGDLCSADCQEITSVCGDGTKQDNEACDDGNTDDGDYCAGDCSAETGSCGDGTRQDNESCDDGNTDDGDYCSFDCSSSDGQCGDGLKQDNEACDDGNTAGNDYCAADCSMFTGRCGDNVVQANEACDDNNTDDGDYCSSDCKTETGSCGDGALQAGEECDDGNGVSGDFCDPGCIDREFLIEGEVGFSQDVTFPPGSKIRFADGARLFMNTRSITVKEGVEFIMGDRSEIVVDGNTFRVDGTEAHPVTFSSPSGQCGKWFGVLAEVSGSVVALRHAHFRNTWRAIYADGVTVDLQDVVATDICAITPATSNGDEPYDVFAVDLRDSEVSIDGLRIARVQGQDGSTLLLRDGGAQGGRGGNAYGLASFGSRITSMNDIEINEIEAGAGSDGAASQNPNRFGGAGGPGGEAAGVRIAGADGDVSMRRIRVQRISSGAGGSAGDGARGNDGFSTPSGTAGSGGPGSNGGDGGAAGTAYGIAVEIAGAFVLENALVAGIRGGPGGAGGDGGDGGVGGSVPTASGRAGAGGDGGDAGQQGQRGNTAGLRVRSASTTALHATIVNLVDGMLDAHGSPGVGGRGGTGGISRSVDGLDGDPATDLVLFGGICALFLGDGVAQTARIAYSAFVVAGQIFGVASDGAAVTSEYNLLHGFEIAPYLDVTPGVGNVAGNPQFVDASGGDFRPTATSPLVNAAETSVTNTDLVGATRDDLPDIGALEYVP